MYTFANTGPNILGSRIQNTNNPNPVQAIAYLGAWRGPISIDPMWGSECRRDLNITQTAAN